MSGQVSLPNLSPPNLQLCPPDTYLCFMFCFWNLDTHRVSLARPLRTLEEGSAERTGPATREPRPFTRAALVVGYEEGGSVLREVTAAMDEINGRALADVQGSLRAYVFTPEVGC